MSKKLGVLMLGLAALSLSRATRAADPLFVLGGKHMLGHRMERADPDIRRRIQATLSEALDYLRASAPEGNHIFRWDADYKLLRGKEFKLLVTHLGDPIFYMIPPDVLKVLALQRASGDRIPLHLHRDTKEGRSYLVGHIFVDEIFVDDEESWRPDAKGRLLASLAYTLFGRVQSYLLLKAEDDPKSVAWRAAEVRDAYRAQADFLKRFSATQSYRKLEPVERSYLDFSARQARRKLRELDGLTSQSCVQAVYRWGLTASLVDPTLN